MATYFKGAALGTHWCLNDARLSGFSPISVAAPHSTAAIIKHIVYGTVGSPYISITRSWMQAKEYALLSRLPNVAASPAQPAYVYEIDVTGRAVQLYDAIVEISNSLPDPYANYTYGHNCDKSLIAAIVQGNLQSYLQSAVVFGPPNNNNAPVAASVSNELRAMLLTLRDAEILALHAIPRQNIIDRHNVW